MTAVVEDDHLVITIADAGRRTVRSVAQGLIDCLEDEPPSPWTKVGRARRRAHERLFPPAYRSRALSVEFTRRHDATIRADLAAAAQRLRDGLDGDGPIRWPLDDTDDWVRVLGTARFLYVDRQAEPGVSAEEGKASMVLAFYQSVVLKALRPDLVEALPPELVPLRRELLREERT